jgi:hypothetical protein
MIHQMVNGEEEQYAPDYPGPTTSDSGPPAPTGGRCTVTKSRPEPDDHPECVDILTLDRADPYVLVLNEILFGLYHRGWQYHPDITLTRPTTGHGSPGHFDINYGNEGPDCGAQLGMVCFKDSVFRIKARNQTAVYRIGNYLPGPKSWEAFWAD